MTGVLDNIAYLKAGERKLLRTSKTVLLYCLRGVINVQVEDRAIHLIEKEMLVINSGEEYGWTSDQDSLILKVSIEDYQLHNALRADKTQIILSSVEHQTRDYNSLRFILDSIVKQTSRDNSFALKSLYYLLWDKVVEDYYVKDNYPEHISKEGQKFQEIYQFIYQHFNENLSLREISEKYGYSESTFSRLFKKHCGEKYVDFLRRVRLEHARSLLLETDSSVADIAFQTGFGNLSVFNRNFLETYGIQPSKYRQKQNAIDDENIASKNDIKQYIDETLTSDGNRVSEEIELNIDANGGYPVTKTVTDVLGPVRANELLTGQLQRTILKIKDDLRMKYLMVTDVMELGFDNDPANPSFEKICLALQIITDQLHLIPILEIDRTADWKGLLSFLELRYTKETIGKWLFKINDSKEYSANEFCNKYISISRDIKGVIPKAKIGAGNINCSINQEKLEKIIEYFQKENAKNEFVSLFCAPFSGEEYKSAYSVSDKHFVENNLNIFEEIAAKYAYKTSLWIEGWDANLVVGDAYNDSCARACHTLIQISDSIEKVEHFCCSRISDWSYVTEQFQYPICGAGGLISKDGLKKPVYYSLFMNVFAPGFCIAKGEGYYVSKTEDDYYCLILYNAQRFNALYYQHDGKVMPEMLDYIFESKKTKTFKLNFSNVKNGTFNAASYEVVSNKNNVLAAWKNLEFKSVLNTGEIEYLNAVCNPKLSYKSEIVSNNVLSLKYVLGPSDFSLIMFTPK